MAWRWLRDAAEAFRRVRQEASAIVRLFPSILCYYCMSRQSRLSSSRAPLLTYRQIVGLLAMLISVDLVEILGILCYELFTVNYFPWHVYPLMLNRAAELLSQLCTQGRILAVFSIAQVFLALFSVTIFSKKQECERRNCVTPLVIYGVLMAYEILVAIVVVNLSKISILYDEDQTMNRSWTSREPNSTRDSLIAIFRRGGHTSRVHDVEEDVVENSSRITLQNIMDMDGKQTESDVLFAVEQPDGERIALARLCKDDMRLEDRKPLHCSKEQFSNQTNWHEEQNDEVPREAMDGNLEKPSACGSSRNSTSSSHEEMEENPNS
ncbi:hypothetical protein KP509_17G028800 [Ceratopteris richardii]|uniref:Uncharacterized protein n=1 Tax=Ceratopteris richardii TaxID=49495 RepID=A0A8T2SWY7_CERRI|nr:hypothetical protein KP509_17G028800 [Ceratopteris richardii]